MSAQLKTPIFFALAGAASWLICIQVAKLAIVYVWDPMLGDSRTDLIVLELSATAVPVFILLCAAALWGRRGLWWQQWMYFFSGLVLCIILKSTWQTHDLKLATSILSKAVFITCAVTSFAAFFVLSLCRPNNRLERSRERLQQAKESVDDLDRSASSDIVATPRRSTSSLEDFEVFQRIHSYLPKVGTWLAIAGWLFLIASGLRAMRGLDDPDLSQDARIALMSGTDARLRIFLFGALGSYLSALLIAIATWRRSSPQSIITIGIMWPIVIIFALRLFNDRVF